MLRCKTCEQMSERKEQGDGPGAWRNGA
jgi:hypothetical protein